MKIQRIFRSSLILCWMISMLWTNALPVRAQQIKTVADNQIMEAKLQEEVIQIEDITELDAEFAALEEESVLIVEEVEKYRGQAQRKKFQRSVVIILVIAIFGVGIVTGLQEKKKKDAVSTDGEKKEEPKVTGGQI